MTICAERRGATRVDKVFRVLVSTEETGDQWFIGRNISSTGMFVEMAQPLPLRTKVIVRFQVRFDEPSVPEICAIARVQNHYYLQFSEGEDRRSLTGVGLRFVRFIPEAGVAVPLEQLH